MVNGALFVNLLVISFEMLHIMSNAMNAMLYPQAIICLILLKIVTTVIITVMTLIPMKTILYTSQIGLAFLAFLTVIEQVPGFQ